MVRLAMPTMSFRSRSIPRWAPPALLAAFLLHILEEAFTFGLYRSRSRRLIEHLRGRGIVMPGEASLLTVLAVVSLVAMAAMIYGHFRPASRGARVAVIALAGTMFANMMVPHLPAAILLGGYAPGLTTALLANLPLSVLVLTISVRSRSMLPS